MTPKDGQMFLWEGIAPDGSLPPTIRCPLRWREAKDGEMVLYLDRWFEGGPVAVHLHSIMWDNETQAWRLFRDHAEAEAHGCVGRTDPYRGIFQKLREGR